MGHWKNLLIESQEDSEENAIADALGITYFDLARTKYEIEENINESGRLLSYSIVFSSTSPKDVLDKIEGLHNNSVEIDIEVLQGDYAHFEYDFETIDSNSDLSVNFFQEVENLRRLNEVDLSDDELNKILKRQIYIGVMGSMETFLSETFIKLTLSDSANLERFVKSHPEFGNRKFDLKDIFEAHKNIETTAKSVMQDTIYHDLRKVREMYKSTFEINFPNIGDAIKCFVVRHDLVHRNGKSKEGVETVLDSSIIEETMTNIIILVKGITDEISAKGMNFDLSGLER